MLKKLISLIVSFVFILSIFTIPVSASSTISVDSILSDFHSEVLDVVLDQPNSRAASDNLNTIRSETVQKLLKLGFEAYEVTRNNFDEMQESLNTDFAMLGLSKDCSYILVVGDDTGTASMARSKIGSTYNYVYNGTTYTMRTIKITSADDSNYMQATPINLLTSHSEAFVQALLDATIGLYTTVLGVPAWIGTIASLTGLTEVNLTATDSTAVYHAGTTWTRTFTQVWDDNFNAWTYGSSVEYATQVCHINGLIYNASTNEYEDYTSGKEKHVTYSQYYYSSTWKNEKAIIGLLSAMPIFYDKTGDACYEKDSVIIVRHREGF